MKKESLLDIAKKIAEYINKANEHSLNSYSRNINYERAIKELKKYGNKRAKKAK